VRILIVDDEAPARDRLRQLLEDTNEHEVVGEAGNGHDALDVASRVQPDVVLLDIRMPGMDGIETAHHLNRTDHPPAVVFTTAYDEYAIDAFDANAIGYVLKPIRRERLEAALSRAARLAGDVLSDVGRKSGVSEHRQHICARAQNRLKLIPIDKVCYFIADQKYVSVVHAEGRDLIDDPLKSLEADFADRFVRIHRSALVALSAIDSLKKDEEGRFRVMLRDRPDDDELVVSRRHVANVKRRLKKG
jgi:two-component system response regulator AlgR